MAYADYNFYAEVYCGAAIPWEDFDRLASRASEYIDYITMGRANDSYKAVKLCCCALAEEYQGIDSLRNSRSDSGPEVQSETVGGHSITYRNTSASISEMQSSLKNIAYMYLGATGLLYRGGGRCVHSSCCDSL